MHQEHLSEGTPEQPPREPAGGMLLPHGSGESGRGNRPSTEVEGSVANPGRTSSKPGEGRADERTTQGPVLLLREEGERHNGAVTRI